MNPTPPYPPLPARPPPTRQGGSRGVWVRRRRRRRRRRGGGGMGATLGMQVVNLVKKALIVNPMHQWYQRLPDPPPLKSENKKLGKRKRKNRKLWGDSWSRIFFLFFVLVLLVWNPIKGAQALTGGKTTRSVYRGRCSSGLPAEPAWSLFFFSCTLSVGGGGGG